MSKLKKHNIINHRRKSIRKLVVYNIGANVIYYFKYQYNVLQRRNKVSPI